MDQKLVTIEGNIGCGKTTLMNYLKGELDKQQFICQTEPVTKWTSYEGLNFLQAYYNDPRKNTFPLQMHIMHTLLDQFKVNQHTPIRITERSLLSQQSVFVELAYQNNQLNTYEKSALRTWFRDSMSRIPHPSLIIYLRVEPATCYSRVLERARKEEVARVNLQYLLDLERCYENWIQEIKDEVPVVIIDSSAEIRQQLPLFNGVKQKLVKMLDN